MSASRSARSGRLALLLSLAVHAGLGLCVLAVPYRGGGRPNDAAPTLNAVAVTTDDDVPLCVVHGRAPPAEVPADVHVRVQKPAEPPAPANPPPAEIVVPDPLPASPDPAEGAGSPNLGPPVQETSPEPSGKSPGAMGSGAGPSGRGTAFFGVEASGQTIVYVIDRSASMGPVGGSAGGFAAAQEELRASLERLPETARFQVILYNLTVEVLPIAGRIGLVAATAENKREAVRLVGERAAEGRTEHLPALVRALGLRPDVVFFLTDADDLTAEQVVKVTQINRQQNRGLTAIHTIELNTAHAGHGDMPLQILARDNHGQYRAVDLTAGR
jgi:hypothetical protein